MLKLLQLGMVLHSKLSYLATLPPSGTPVCSLTIPLSGGSDGIHPPYAAYFGPIPHSDLRRSVLGCFHLFVQTEMPPFWDILVSGVRFSDTAPSTGQKRAPCPNAMANVTVPAYRP